MSDVTQQSGGGEWKAAAAGAGMGMVSDIINRSASSKAAAEAYKYARKMSIFNKEQQIDLFNKTGFEAQVNQMQNAGLSTGLMYGKSGSGGSTGLATGNVPVPVFESKMAKSMEIGMQAAQIELANSQAEKNRVEAEKIAGAETANLAADTKLKEINAGIQTVAKEVAENTKVDQIMKIQAEAGKLRGEMNSAIANGTIANETVRTQISQAQATLIETYLKNKLTMANIEYTEEQTKAIADQIAVGYINAFANRRNAGSNEDNADSNTQRQIKDALYQNGLLERMDRKLNQDLIFGVGGLLSGMPQQQTPTETRTIENRYDKDGNYQGQKSTTTKRNK